MKIKRTSHHWEFHAPKKEKARNLERIDFLWSNGNKSDARKIAYRGITWRCLFLYFRCFLPESDAIDLANNIKQIKT